MNEKNIKTKISELAAAHGAIITHFQYYKKVFGNLVVILEYNSQMFEIIVDRGEIYCNKNLVCDNSYHIAGKNDLIDKLMEVIASLFEL